MPEPTIWQAGKGRPWLRVTGALATPLIPPEAIDRINMNRVLKMMSRSLLARLRVNLSRAPVTERARRAFAKSIKVEVKAKTIVLSTSHPGFMPVLKGQAKGQMSWLTKARAPIPLITDGGEVIFRSATPKSMADGKWKHPGRAPTKVIEMAKEGMREKAREFVMEELRRSVRKAKRGRKR